MKKKIYKRLHELFSLGISVGMVELLSVVFETISFNCDEETTDSET